MITGESHRSLILRLAACCFGFACGVFLQLVWHRPAPAAQLPGLMTSLGLDAHASQLFLIGLIALSLLAGLTARWWTRPFAEAATREWSFREPRW